MASPGKIRLKRTDLKWRWRSTSVLGYFLREDDNNKKDRLKMACLVFAGCFVGHSP